MTREVGRDRLVKLLEEHRSDIVERWLITVLERTPTHYHERPRQEVATWLASAFDALAASIASDSPEPLLELTAHLGLARQELGFTIDEVIDTQLRLKDAALPAITANVPADQQIAVINRFNEGVRLMASSFGARFAAVLREKEQRLAVLEERQRLARDLHDSVSQSLAAVAMYAEAATRLLTAGSVQAAAEHLSEVQATSRQALREMRLLIFELRPAALPEEGLVGAVKARLAAVERRSGVEVVCDIGNLDMLPEETEAQLYGIATEALNNCLRYAAAKRIMLHIGFVGEQLVMEIRDDGLGFEVGEAAGRGGLGIRGMEERARELGAVLSITSAPGCGTTVRLELEGATAGTRVEEERSW